MLRALLYDYDEFDLGVFGNGARLRYGLAVRSQFVDLNGNAAGNQFSHFLDRRPCDTAPWEIRAVRVVACFRLLDHDSVSHNSGSASRPATTTIPLLRGEHPRESGEIGDDANVAPPLAEHSAHGLCQIVAEFED